MQCIASALRARQRAREAGAEIALNVVGRRSSRRIPHMTGAFKSPVFSDVTAAAVRLGATRSIHRTPLLESVALNLLTGARVRQNLPTVDE